MSSNASGLKARPREIFRSYSRYLPSRRLSVYRRTQTRRWRCGCTTNVRMCTRVRPATLSSTTSTSDASIRADANHKPEMALALTPFQAMCGFLPLARIADYIVDTHEFAALIPQAIREQFLSIASSDDSTGPAEKKALKDLFTAVMTAQEAVFKPELEKLVARYQSGGAKASEKEVVELALRLNSQFPGDIGVFCAFILNHLVLKPGEAIFLAAGEPHAYVSGGQ